MKDKKKVGLVKRIAAGVCAVMLVFGSFGMSEAFYARDVVPIDNVEDCFASFEFEFSEKSCEYSSYCDTYFDSYKYFIFHDSGRPRIYFSNSLPYAKVSVSENEKGIYYVAELIFPDHSDACRLYLSDSGEWKEESTFSNITIAYLDDLYSNDSVIFSQTNISDLNFDVLFENGVVFFRAPMNKGAYSPSLGYLQDLLCKELYLEDAEYAYDPNYLKKIWTFSNTSTSGLDITDGSYSVRHYQQITVRDTDIKDPVVKEYDMVLMDEFPAESLRYEYLSKDYSSKLESQSGFESLNFWETSILGQFVFTRNYFQLVRTNEDGSVEYGGYVKIDLKGSPAANDLNAEHETTTMTPEGETDLDGYVGGNMDYIQGSGSDYGQAENNADKNYENESSSSSGSNDIVTQLENFSAVVMAVPRLIAELFSFLPDWCLDFVGAAFSISVAILVYKLAN